METVNAPETEAVPLTVMTEGVDEIVCFSLTVTLIDAVAVAVAEVEIEGDAESLCKPLNDVVDECVPSAK